MREDYLNLGYQADERKELICQYRVEPSREVSLREASNHIAGESSIDTWSEILTLSPKIARKLKPSVFYLSEKKKTIKIAYSPELFEIGNVAQILSAIAGNILSMKLVKNIRLEDVSFPREIAREFNGPKFGIAGVRKLLKVKKRPLIGTIVKPKVGLIPKEHAKVAYEAFAGGCDLVKDDENLTNQKFNPFQRRVKLTLKGRDKAERETGERKVYLPNVTAPTCKEMLKRVKFVKKNGGRYVMIDIIPTGWTALQTLREENENLKLIIHAHRCMHSAFTRNPKQGVSMLVVAKLTRLIGLDQLHIGTAVGKMHGDKEEILELKNACTRKWYNFNPIFPVSSGGLQPLMIPELLKIFGKDVILQFGGGIHAHPLGTMRGAKAARDALDATLGGVPLKEYSKKSKELKAAIEKWGKRK